LEDGLAGSIADELGPTPAPEVTSAVADFDGSASEPAPSLVQADVQRDPVPQPEPVSQPAEMQPAAYAQPEPVEERTPAPSAEETSQEAERAAARRRSTVREKVSFVTSAPAGPAPSVNQSEPEPVESPASAPAEPASATSGDDAPRKAGWWSRRFGSGE
jgi:ribonuclease E